MVEILYFLRLLATVRLMAQAYQEGFWHPNSGDGRAYMAHQASATIVKLVQIGEVHQLSNFARGYWALNFPPRAGKFSSFPVSVRTAGSRRGNTIFSSPRRGKSYFLRFKLAFNPIYLVANLALKEPGYPTKIGFSCVCKSQLRTYCWHSLIQQLAEACTTDLCDSLMAVKVTLRARC